MFFANHSCLITRSSDRVIGRTKPSGTLFFAHRIARSPHAFIHPISPIIRSPDLPQANIALYVLQARRQALISCLVL